ncbi:serpin family protein [Clostridium sp. MD294]|uniref:serpin family protein n=2 Tax=Clostridium sp. MD294 TaxID=97138 RepID=UPI0002C9C1D5|nr:serpin family protein [Clostridium sp. MD294]USF31015.1 hypothetical protein C820_002461 [Clostridium sp. MD294]
MMYQFILKKILFFIILLYFTNVVFAEENNIYSIYENGRNEIIFQNSPYQHNDIIYVPLRELAERGGSLVHYSNSEISVLADGNVTLFKIGEQKAICNFSEISLHAPVQNKNGVCYIAVEDIKYITINFINNLNYVEYEKENNTISVYLREKKLPEQKKDFKNIDFVLKLLNEAKSNVIISPKAIKHLDFNNKIKKEDYFSQNILLDKNDNIVNEVYFCCPWRYAFSEEHNISEAFYYKNSIENQIFMCHTSLYEYYKDANITALSTVFRTEQHKELPYEITFLLSENNITSDMISNVNYYKDESWVNLKLPKVKLDSYIQLNAKELNVDKEIIQKVSFDFGQKGINTNSNIEADGFSSVMTNIMDFNANKPFYFCITDTRNDDVLFVGKYGFE